MTSIKTYIPVQLRARAREARQRAAGEADATIRKVLLNDAELWERMAEYEEKKDATDVS
jgi:hypothetical protein